MTSTAISIARKAYQAYVDKDRAAIEAVIADDFHFSSPLDNRLDRKTYFERCWKNCGQIAGIDIINAVSDGERVFVTYEGQSTAGKRHSGRSALRDSDGVCVRRGGRQLPLHERALGFALEGAGAQAKSAAHACSRRHARRGSRRYTPGELATLDSCIIRTCRRAVLI